MAGRLPGVLMVGTGEYTTGFVHTGGSTSDKKVGVVALVMFDLRRRGKIGEVVMSGTNGTKFPLIREHFQKNIANVYRDMDVSFRSFPADDVQRDVTAYKAALEMMSAGDLCTIFTPDDTHLEIALAAIEKGLHVLVTKPPVHTTAQHQQLIDAARRKNVVVAVEVHKRWDPIYRDAWQRIHSGALGSFSYFTSYMSQPKTQLETFRSWAGRSSDISYYLNSHHIDFHCWALNGRARPIRVVAMASKGIANSPPHNIDAEDVITLMVQWENIGADNSFGTAVYTSSWAAPKSDVHSQQRFHYVGSNGEATVDQAHRGYSVAMDGTGYASVNPLFMKYTPNADGVFDGQQGYGYRSFEEWVDAATEANALGEEIGSRFDGKLAMIHSTITATAVLEAGRLSLDNNGASVVLVYDSTEQCTPTAVTL